MCAETRTRTCSPPGVSDGDDGAASPRSGIFKRICKELYKLTQVCDYPLQRKACWDTPILGNFVPLSRPELEDLYMTIK